MAGFLSVSGVFVFLVHDLILLFYRAFGAWL